MPAPNDLLDVDECGDMEMDGMPAESPTTEPNQIGQGENR